MKNINVDWNLSPKGATELVKVALIGQKWRNSKTKRYWDMNGDFAGYYGEGSPIDEAEVFATRPQPKTVADAYEWAKGEWQDDRLAICELEGELYFSDNNLRMRRVVCTHEQFEAYAKEQEAKQEGEKWTHGIPADGIYCKVKRAGEFVNCYLIGRDDMGSFVYRIDGEYLATADERSFKPIKPKLTAKEYDACVDMASHFNIDPNEFEEYMSKFDIAEGPAND